jgi:superfamily I DNA and/or RNA helicase
MLKEDYRMHPHIAEFPSCVAYQGLLYNEHATKHDDDPLWIEWENF